MKTLLTIGLCIASLSLVACNSGGVGNLGFTNPNTSSNTTSPNSSSNNPNNSTDSNNNTQATDNNNNPPPTSKAECDPERKAMPATPAAGASRDGLACAIAIPIPADAEIPGQPSGNITFQIFEPGTLTGGEKYPLILDGHGFSASRAQAPSDSGSAGLSVPTGPIVRAGYGMISIDQAGHGETGGLIRVMDPDQEGRFLIAILDWAEANLDWLAYGPDDDAEFATDADAAANPDHNLLLGAIGPSYGGGYQLLIHAIDPKKRLDAIVPQITWHDLSYSVFPGTVPKSIWGAALFSLGNTAGNNDDRGHFDPFVQRTFASALSEGRVSPAGLDYFRYHGLGYFCDQLALPTATNGDDGTINTVGNPYNVDYPPLPPTKINAIFWQGMRDVLFNFNEAYSSYSCLAQLGGDVRLLSYQSGHNTLPVVQDPYATPDNSLISTCGEFDPTAGAIAFFDEYLKGETGKTDTVLPPGDKVCLSLHGTDAVLIDETAFPAGTQNTTVFTLPETLYNTAAAGLFPVALDYDFARDGDALAGIPHADIEISCVDPVCEQLDPTSIVLFVGTAVNTNGSWAVADNQILPLRGIGTHTVDLIGIGERLTANAQIGLALFGTNDQFAAQGSTSANVFSPAIANIRINGEVYMPLVDTSTLTNLP